MCQESESEEWQSAPPGGATSGQIDLAAASLFRSSVAIALVPSTLEFNRNLRPQASFVLLNLILAEANGCGIKIFLVEQVIGTDRQIQIVSYRVPQ